MRQHEASGARGHTNARRKRLGTSAFVAYVAPIILSGCFPSFPDFPLDTGAGGSAGGASKADGGESIGHSCQTGGDCDGNPCVAGFCRRACTKEADCPTSSICLSDGVASGCRLTDEATCTPPSGCSNTTLTCGIDGTCRMPCTGQCGREGLHCIAGVCVGDLEPGAASTWFSCQSDAGFSGHFCDGTALSACNESKPGVSVLAQCSSAGICAASAASGKSTCGAESCKDGDLACGGAAQTTLQRCNADHTGFEAVDGTHTCATAALCGELRDSIQNPAGTIPPCPAPACAPNDGRCVNATPETCNAGRTGFDSSAPCTGGEPQCDPFTKACIALGVDATEVKRADYQRFLAEIQDPDSGPPTTQVVQIAACNWNTDFTPVAHWTAADQADGTMPVSNVDWCDAVAYCAHAGKRLCGKIGGTELAKTDFADPGKSQWMNACSSGGQHPFPYGDWQGLASESTCNGAGNWLSTETPHAVKVGSLAACTPAVAGYANVFDLSGNLAEWEDACDASHDAGRSSDACRLRGGSFDDDVQAKLACNADRVAPRSSTFDDVGFRCCGL